MEWRPDYRRRRGRAARFASLQLQQPLALLERKRQRRSGTVRCRFRSAFSAYRQRFGIFGQFFPTRRRISLVVLCVFTWLTLVYVNGSYSLSLIYLYSLLY